MEHIETVVIGAGVVGLACARELARAGQEVLVLEQADVSGTETSSRNSEVIHAGIYYPTDSLKATLCVAGNKKLYAFCDEYNVAYKRCGKLIVASSDSQNENLQQLNKTAIENNVHDLRFVNTDELRELEPELSSTRALLSPSTGIIDSHAYMLALQGDLESHGGMIAFNCAVEKFDGVEASMCLTITDGTKIKADRIVNSAGLHAVALAARTKDIRASAIPNFYIAKGNYFSYSGKSPFSHLIYPVPEKAGLGVHLTLDLAGQARFGPDVQWIDEIDYAVDASRSSGFYAAIRNYWPNLPDASLLPAYSGIRPKLQGPGDAAKDFVVQTEREHGVTGLINLFGIESPGLTSSLALAEYVKNLLLRTQ